MADFRWVEINNKDELEAFYRNLLPKIREVAREMGYAIGVHGSMRRDFDLIAVPWVDAPCSPEALARAIHQAVCGLESQTYSWEQKSAWRLATMFPVCWINWDSGDEKGLGHIDLSVTPGKPY